MGGAFGRVFVHVDATDRDGSYPTRGGAEQLSDGEEAHHTGGGSAGVGWDVVVSHGAARLVERVFVPCDQEVIEYVGVEPQSLRGAGL